MVTVIWRMKVVFFVYLWYPKTKLSMRQKSTEKIMELRARAWDFSYSTSQLCPGCSIHLHPGFSICTRPIAPVPAAAAANQPPNVNVKTQSPVETESEPNSPPAPRALNKSYLQKQTSRGRKWPPPTPPQTPGREAAGTFNGEGVDIPDTIPGSPITDARARLRRSNSRSQAAS
ncbi:hypothetical protein HID58_095952 [Brassica napus]|uniref:Uncharacterized protein n=1 Tax=Brassica napus TaxID=3708 RepID=A0ABQ7X2A5_BRANA|nr:hypothetical protein HID58_095952 [Brassica napus]